MCLILFPNFSRKVSFSYHASSCTNTTLETLVFDYCSIVLSYWLIFKPKTSFFSLLTVG
uniref:Uncharacterized protein n=1 Tax=Arundo donax TaxID=35708 RepID=A0A0A9HZ74_ARUDO